MSGHKKQLHERILRRQSQLQAALEELEEAAGPRGARSKHEIALADALAALDTHLASEWETVGALEASELSRWLESTQFLVDESRSTDRAEGIWRRLETQWKLSQFGVPKPAAQE